jgi:hypothetical protein
MAAARDRFATITLGHQPVAATLVPPRSVASHGSRMRAPPAALFVQSREHRMIRCCSDYKRASLPQMASFAVSRGADCVEGKLRHHYGVPSHPSGPDQPSL